jgi:uncharacterized protein YdiU (UPF0061 family)
MNALTLAIRALQDSRRSRIQRVCEAIDAEDTRQDYALKYLGCQNGQHLGQLPNGGILPVEASSNGALRRGETFAATKGAGATKAIGQWMPR